jgi:hypothetical protein
VELDRDRRDYSGLKEQQNGKISQQNLQPQRTQATALYYGFVALPSDAWNNMSTGS